MDMARGLLMLRLTMALAMAATAMVDSATDMARGPLMPMPTMADMAMAVMAMVDLATDTARGLPMLMPTMALMVLAMAMAVLDTDTARGLLMPMSTTAATAMEAMAMVVLATAMALMAMASNSSSWKKNHQPNTRAKKSSFPNSNLDLNLYIFRKIELL